MLQRRRWERTRDALQHYRRRAPEQTPLYRIVYHGRDELPRVWEERFQATYGVLRDEVLTTFDEYLNRGLLAHGAARVYCDTCKHSLLVAFSCKKRGLCPSCNAKRSVKFGEHLYDAVLERIPHRHCGFTVPKRLRAYFRYDRRLNGILFRAAYAAVRTALGSDTQPSPPWTPCRRHPRPCGELLPLPRHRHRCPHPALRERGPRRACHPRAHHR
jgi:hypothetical protein